MRRALLEDPAHAAEIREALRREDPDVLLIIGISEDMIGRVARNLGLPPPARIIPIEAMASPRQMRKALRIRRSEDKHVIPAPTLEVRKGFDGYRVDPLRVFLKAREERRALDQEQSAPGHFIEKSVVRPTWSSLGRFYIEEVVLAAIAARAAVETPGVGRVHHVKVETTEAGVALELHLGLVYGSVIADVADQARRSVATVLEHMTALTCRRVDIRITSILPPTMAGPREGPSERR